MKMKKTSNTFDLSRDFFLRTNVLRTSTLVLVSRTDTDKPEQMLVYLD